MEINTSSPKEFMFSIIQPEPIIENHVSENVEQVPDFLSTPKFVAGLSLPEITAVCSLFFKSFSNIYSNFVD